MVCLHIANKIASPTQQIKGTNKLLRSSSNLPPPKCNIASEKLPSLWERIVFVSHHFPWSMLNFGGVTITSKDDAPRTGFTSQSRHDSLTSPPPENGPCGPTLIHCSRKHLLFASAEHHHALRGSMLEDDMKK